MQKRKTEKEIENRNIFNNSTKDEEVTPQPSRERRLSYTLTSPMFEHDILPNIPTEAAIVEPEIIKSADVTTTEPIDIESETDDEVTFKSSKDMSNEIDKRNATIVFESDVEPEVNNRLKDLIEKQKREYLCAMDALKRKFSVEQEKLLTTIETNLLATSTPLTNLSLITTDDEDFTEFKTCIGQSNEFLADHDVEEQTLMSETIENERREKAATILNAFVRGYLTRRLMKTIYVQEHIRNINETLQLVLSLDNHSLQGSPVQNILLKAKLFRQLSLDLKNFNDIFFDTSTKEKMKIIASDREIKGKRMAEENNQQLNLSFNNVV